MKEFWSKEHRLILALLALVALLNVPYGRYALYPFMLFSTWIHEACHGVAAMLVGGEIVQLQIFADGSGLATSYLPNGTFSRAWVVSAGYVGTSVLGALMLMFRRKPKAGRIGLTLIGVLIVLSVVLYVRNGFGIMSLLSLGLILTASGWFLPADISGGVYAFLASACCLNAITSIQILFGATLVVDGKPAGGSDAHTVADVLFLPYWFWASLWIVFGLAIMLLALRRPLKASG